MTIERRHRGRPRSISWVGKLGAFVTAFTVDRLAKELDLGPPQIYRWVKGDNRPPIRKAIALVEVARAAGRDLSLEDIFESDITMVRARMRASSLPPL